VRAGDDSRGRDALSQAAGEDGTATPRRWAVTWSGLLAGLLALAVPLGTAACRAVAEQDAELLVGTSWVGRGAETLSQELLRVAAGVGSVTIDLRFFSQTGLNDYLLRSQPASGPGLLDLVVIPSDWLVRLYERDLITELPVSRVEALEQHLVRQALLGVSDGDRVLAYPVSAEVLALIYDPARFASPPRTMDDILNAPLPNGVLPFALDVLNPTHLTPLVASLQGSLLDRDGNFVWRAADLVSVVGRLAPLWRHQGAWEVCRSDDPESLQLQLFNEGMLASFVGGPWLLAALEASGRPFAVMPIPAFADSPHPARALVGYQCVAVLRETRWIDLALEVGASLTEEDASERINRATRRLPVLLSAYQSRRAMTAPGTVGFLRALEEGQAFPPSVNWSDAFQRIENRLQRLRTLVAAPSRGDLERMLLDGGS